VNTYTNRTHTETVTEHTTTEANNPHLGIVGELKTMTGRKQVHRRKKTSVHQHCEHIQQLQTQQASEIKEPAEHKTE
jgi:hypothetical protein